MLAKSKLNSIKLIDSVVSHDEFVLVNNVLKEYNELKEEIKVKDLISLLKILVYLWNVIVLFKADKKYRKYKFKSCKDKKRKNNDFIKTCSVW